ncbi:uncharacterized protein N7458_007844 [Penicillium daleae]|uniref:Ankyrin repeat protein n=1 Tax=Penicillium daleae TaxID=63821 RepID=A0AAD6C1C8_9EURO|nr:uncharacterized protein N7458_007844 [Penicillium daleae]KAJ5443972.1 hypothetical protein N7458_007844 [Penicillium daleae]
MADDEGASPRELVVEACRRDQPHLIEQVLHDMENQSNEDVAKFFNKVTDSMGNHALHICASYGSYDDTPLHTAVRFANEKDAELGAEMIAMMCEAGCDPRVRNKHGQKPADLVYDKPAIKQTLASAEYILAEGIRNDEGNGSVHDSASDSE